VARENLVESVVGAVVLAAAAGFLFYALGAGGVSRGGRGYQVTASFGQVGGLASGADVRVAGVKVGVVSGVELDPKTYLALTRFELDSSVKLPSDSTAKIASDGLLGGSHVSIEPGGSLDNLADGGEITNTQGAVDLFGMIGGMMRPQAALDSPAAPPALEGSPPSMPAPES
jgi:phospholipid/cholesterol/gamma-HCH transport system substrate-binding protein